MIFEVGKVNEEGTHKKIVKIDRLYGDTMYSSFMLPGGELKNSYGKVRK
jgi:hypothetical protein